MMENEHQKALIDACKSGDEYDEDIWKVVGPRAEPILDRMAEKIHAKMLETALGNIVIGPWGELHKGN